MKKNRRHISLLSSLLAAGLLLSGPLPAQPAASVYENHAAIDFEVLEEYSTGIAPGVTHSSLTMTLNGTLQSVQMMAVDTTNPLTRLKAVSSRDEVSRSETVGYMIQEQEASGHRVTAAVNGDFFSSVGVPSGLQITDGEIITSSSSIKTLIAVYEDGTVKLEDAVSMTAELNNLSGETLSFNMINRTRVPSHGNHAFLFTPRFGESTRTPDNGGVEVIIAAGTPEYRLKAGESLSGTVLSIEETSDSPIAEGQFLVSVTGDKADWVRNHLSIGDEVEIGVSFNKGINEAHQVISGNSTLGKVLLKDGVVPEEILDPSDSLNTARHPRTMLATNGEQLFAVVVDGRQSGHSEGITLAEGAYYLQALGADQAINIDGGGSSTYYARLPGDEHPRLMNRTSDGPERTVGNSLMLLTEAPAAELDALVIEPQGPLLVAPGSRVQLAAKGIDAHYNPLSVEPGGLQWSVTREIGKVDDEHYFTARDKERNGRITVRKGKIASEIEVIVTDEVERLELSPRDFVIEPGGSMRMKVRAYNADGSRIVLSNDQIAWSADSHIGTIAADGVFSAVNGEADGWITAAYGPHSVQAKVKIGPSAVVEPFESAAYIRASEVRTVPGSTTVTLVRDPEPVRFGNYAAKFTYDFTGTEGTSGAYVQFLDANGQVGRPVEGQPERFGVWVYGDGRMHHLRLGITDGTGTNRLWNFTTSNGLNWTGWRYVSLSVPDNTVFPIQIRNIALEESNVNNKTAGTLYFDNFTAEYTDSDD